LKFNLDKIFLDNGEMLLKIPFLYDRDQNYWDQILDKIITEVMKGDQLMRIFNKKFWEAVSYHFEKKSQTSEINWL